MKRKYKRLSTRELLQIKQVLSALPHPLFIERKGTGPVRVVDGEGDAIELTAYHQLKVLLKFVKRNCPHQ